MGKMRTKPQSASVPSPEAIIVDDPSEVITPCLKVLRTVLGDHAISFDETPLANNEVKFGLTGSPVKGIARDKYSLFLLVSIHDELFWLGASLVFKRELGSYRLMSVSLVVFKGEGFDERKTALLRAEWDNPEPGAKTIHAQPHWHVYPRLINRESGNTELAGAVTTQVLDSPIEDDMESDEEDLDWPTSANFHYAMASSWQTDVNAHQEKLNELSRLLSWLRGCVSYSRDQLQFLFS